MKKIVILLLLFSVGCTNKVTENDIEKNENPKNDYELRVKDNLNFEFSQNVYLYDLFEDTNGIKNENKLIDTSSLGEHKIKINFNDNEENIIYHVSDTTAPVINVSNMSTTIGKKVDFLSSLMCGDNYDRDLNCEISGEYDFDKVGTYMLKISATDSNGNKNEKDFKLTVKEKNSSSSSSTKNYYYFDDLIKQYKTDETMVGIDVSVWQGNIDWEKVRAAGCEFAMIRIGLGHYKNREIEFDGKFKENIKKAKEAGIKVGLYFYSYAKTSEDAKMQAKWVVEALNGEKLDLPIAFDWEIWSGFSKYNLNFNDLNQIANAFIDEINKHGYEGVIYGSAFYINRVWNLNAKTWLAYYTSNNDFEKPYFMWQLSSIGKIDGINGYVDLNVLYKKESN